MRMKKIIALIAVGLLVVPLVIVGSGFTTVLHNASVVGGFLDYQQVDYWGSNIGDDPGDDVVVAASGVEVINLGDSSVSSLTTFADTLGDMGWRPSVQKYTSIEVDPCAVPPCNPYANNAYASQYITWSADGEAYLTTGTYAEDGHALSSSDVYGKGGDGPNYYAVEAYSNEGFSMAGYSALGDYCEGVNAFDPGTPTIPTVPSPDCGDGCPGGGCGCPQP
jgi:hypothetical protein